MKLIKVGAGIVNQTPLDWEGNFQRLVGAIEQARTQGVSLLCLPELCISGYGCEDAFFAPNTFSQSLKYLLALRPYTRGMVVSVGLPLLVQNKAFNCACLLVDGEIAGFVAKKFLAGNGIHYEPRWFTPWTQEGYTTVRIEGKDYKVGDIYFRVDDVKIGFEICEDAWVANRPGRQLYLHGIDVILNPSASHFAFGKLEVRKRFILDGSRAFGVTYVYSNLLGNEAGRVIYDGGGIIACNGQLVAAGERLSFDDYNVTSAVVDIELSRLAQVQMQTQFAIDKDFGHVVEVDFHFPNIHPEAWHPQEADWEHSPFLKEEEFARAMMLGLFDYMRKSRSRGFVISLSGGADSSAISVLCRMLIDEGIRRLGMEGFKQKLAYFKEIQDCKSADEIAQKMITVAYQATRNSSETTRRAAEELAKAIHAEYHHLDIDAIIQQYIALISESIGRPLTWEKDDLTLQNIQARGRAPSIWMLANLKNALLLSTSNRSEAAVGYATMDGDTAGGLSPIAGIDKAYLRRWLRWMETEGLGGHYRIPALRYVNEQQPTAELRPPDSKQTDEADLMPYEILDDIEEAAIRDKRAPVDCYLLLRQKYPQYEADTLKAWVKKFFRLWCRNQWKRERYAPSFHLDDANLDPKTWCRFPILSGGFEEELRALDEIT
ncbi:NAD+ synthase (glutamine-hydrolysing) [Thermonema lapsum]|uniref:Glutamine-dependent NAD(+) synthetase n=1 Tax=Thermonema lapsum TaxID=28195 RepID=A0A846MMH6_9BACT|nr:NAD(+) synthase [Thermonema lapsum]NIK72632.1 NAD+ synthase (glutamine-hydrolysing) [Thermonema lapsum]